MLRRSTSEPISHLILVKFAHVLDQLRGLRSHADRVSDLAQAAQSTTLVSNDRNHPLHPLNHSLRMSIPSHQRQQSSYLPEQVTSVTSGPGVPVISPVAEAWSTSPTVQHTSYPPYPMSPSQQAATPNNFHRQQHRLNLDSPTGSGVMRDRWASSEYQITRDLYQT